MLSKNDQITEASLGQTNRDVLSLARNKTYPLP